MLIPVVHPLIDLGDVSHLKADNSANLYYSDRKAISMTSQTSLVSIPRTQYPIVRLEHTSYVSSMTCSSESAILEFSTQTAFQTSAADWKQKIPFILVSYVSSCGAGYSSKTRDYLLVHKFAPNPSSKSITATITHVDFSTAIGPSSEVNVQIGTSASPRSSSKAKRSPTEGQISGVSSELRSSRRSVAPRVTGSKTGTFSFNNFQTITLLQDDSLTVQCVGCGGSGTITLVGSLTFTIANGLTAASINLSGNMQATVQVSLTANNLSKDINIGSKDLATIPLADISIPGIASLGPEIKISSSADVTISATGSLTAGADLNWPSFQANMDAVALTASASGFTPSLTPIDQISGTVSASLNLNLPVSIGIAIDILNGKFDKSVDLTDTPTLALTGSVSNGGSCSGVEISATLSNKVDANNLDLDTIDIADSSAQLFSKCLGTQTTTTATSGAASSTPTSAAQKKRQAFAQTYDSF